MADTQALVFHLVEPRKLGKAARRAFEAADAGKSRCHVPAIVLVEVAEQCLECGALVGIKDPMDRLVAAASRVARTALVSSDAVFDAHLERVWGSDYQLRRGRGSTAAL